MKIPFLKRDLPKSAAAALVALVAVAGVVTGREKPAMELIEVKAARIETSVVLQDIDLQKLHRVEGSLPQNDPFARRSFASTPQPGADTVPAAPTAPALPFRYFGKLTEKGRTDVFIMRGDDLILISAGQKIDAHYRVDHISDAAIGFTYLPLNTKQSLPL
jgi:hypothetical protein